MTRINRQAKILDLIQKDIIDTQEELAELLRAEGYAVTQATVSRDIKELNIIKTLSEDGKRYRYAASRPRELSTQNKFISIFRNVVLSIEAAGNLVIIKTETGSANAAAELVDRLDYDEVMGVIAGDNTIFIAVDNIYHVEDVVDRLRAFL